MNSITGAAFTSSVRRANNASLLCSGVSTGAEAAPCPAADMGACVAVAGASSLGTAVNAGGMADAPVPFAPVAPEPEPEPEPA